MNDKDLHVNITNILKSIGMPANLKGFKFARQGTKILYKNSRIKTMDLYKVIARHNHTREWTVERALRYAIGYTWLHGSLEEIESMFCNTVSPDKGMPTNTLFLKTVVDELASYE